MTPDETGIDEALAGLPLEEDPPADLHARVRERLHVGGLIGHAGGEGGRRAVDGRGGDRPWGRRVWAVAAVAVLAFLAGRASVATDRPGPVGGADPLWVLLLYEDERFDTGGRPVAEVVALYDRWADEARTAGTLVLAEKLGNERVVVDPGGGGVVVDPSEGGSLSGLFVVRADDAEAAADLARSMPHARFGGTIVVRSVDPT